MTAPTAPGTTRWEAWLDENGTSAGKQVNEAASRLAQSFGWQLSLAGPVVIVGLDQDTDPAALSPGQIDAILEKTNSPGEPGWRSGPSGSTPIAGSWRRPAAARPATAFTTPMRSRAWTWCERCATWE